MKKTVLFPFFLFCFLSVFAQSSSFHFADEFYFVKEIPVNNYGGKQFRYEIAVRSNPSDTMSRIRIHGIAAGASQGRFFEK